MILNKKNLDQRMSVDVQNKEIERIKEAPEGTVLFLSPIKSNADVIETLLHICGVRYVERVSDYMVRYCKA